MRGCIEGPSKTRHYSSIREVDTVWSKLNCLALIPFWRCFMHACQKGLLRSMLKFRIETYYQRRGWT
ncbi:hypothetical protein MKW98_022836 [Papaver atlanticum]|uniref:Uncharacterized protein n=1 Tax=Papaver atlanticum TaxID=357466 RepID=A0AAD4XYR5_9MAGN|nr:hypothetical protein MKW98_022836 [Papaver atlanticum]